MRFSKFPVWIRREGSPVPPDRPSKLGGARTWEMVWRYVRSEQESEPIDLFLSDLAPRQIDVPAITELRRTGVPCVNFFCDNVREFRKVPAEYRPFDLHWVPEFEALSMYRAAKLSHAHLPMPCWTPPELRSIPASEAEPPTFVGSADVLRRDLLERALLIGADFIVRGPGWEDDRSPSAPKLRRRSIPLAMARQLSQVYEVGPCAFLRKLEKRLHPSTAAGGPSRERSQAVFGDEYTRVMREAVVAVGVNRVPTVWASDRRPVTYSRLRDIEATMLGACYLAEWAAGLEQLFELGAEVEVYRTPEDLRDKLIDLKADRDRRREMRPRGQRRALSEYSVGQSVDKIRQHLGLRSA